MTYKIKMSFFRDVYILDTIEASNEMDALDKFFESYPGYKNKPVYVEKIEEVK